MSWVCEPASTFGGGKKLTGLTTEQMRLSQTQKCEYDDVVEEEKEGESESLDTSYLYIN